MRLPLGKTPHLIGEPLARFAESAKLEQDIKKTCNFGVCI